MSDPIQAPDAQSDISTADALDVQAPVVQEASPGGDAPAVDAAPPSEDSGVAPEAQEEAGGAPASEGIAPEAPASEQQGVSDEVAPVEAAVEVPVQETVVADSSASALDLSRLVEIFNPLNAPGNIQTFLETGGNVLLVIMVATFVMWALIVERIAFFSLSGDKVKKNAIKTWSARHEHKSWFAHVVRDKLISEVDLEATKNINLIKGLVGVAPLLGLLGTVTGMIAVFDVMAVTGSSNARLMAAGISKATIPTMAGLVTSLFGIAMMNILESRARRLITETTDQLVIK